MSNQVKGTSNKILAKVEAELGKITDEDKRRRLLRFIVAAMSSIPWIGGLFSASTALHSEIEQAKSNELFNSWLEEHQNKIGELGLTIQEIIERFDSLGDIINERLESEEYLQIVTKAFRTWDKSDTIDKRQIIRNLIANSAAINLCSDDVIRLFIDWIERYHESHFYVIKFIYLNHGITRGEIWDRIYPNRPREDSAEADLYKLLIRDLSTGGVIRQHRPTDYSGNFIKKAPSRKGKSRTMKSAFDTTEPYELTELGAKFVHYCMEDIVKRIE